MKKLAVSITFVLVLLIIFSASAMAQVGPSYTSGFQVQNLSSSDTASISITFYNQDGTTANTVSDTIDPSSSNNYFPLSAVSDGFNGSVVISSDQPVAAITNLLGNGGSFGGASYSGFSSGDTSISIPLVFKNAFNINTFFNVQNAGSNPTTVNVSYPGTSCTDSATVQPGAAATFDQSVDTCLSNGHIGSATITSSEPVVASVVQVDTDSLLASNGFTSGTTSDAPVIPLVVNNIFATSTGIQVQNTEGTSTDVTISYTPTAGNPGEACTETQSVPAGQSVTFGIQYLIDNCETPGTAGFVGSARVTGNTAGHLLATVVNQVELGAANASAYNAFDASQGSSRVEIPLIIRDLGISGGTTLFTGFNIVNVGSSATSVSCTFANSTATVPATSLDPGEALNAVQSGAAAGALPAGYVGSATCIATGGDTSIVGVVNQVGGFGDLILTYEAFNQ